MPSGSHRGSRGSHRRGGSRSRSHSRSRGHHHRRSGIRHFRPRYFRFGRRRYYISGVRGQAIGFISIFIILLITAMIVGGGLMISAQSTIRNIKDDRDYYLEMISYAESTTIVNERIRTATDVDCFKLSNLSKWYITYKIDIEDGTGGKLEGYSYSVYTLQEASALRNQGTVQVAINSSVVTNNTDSIPLDYKNKSLADDAEYANAKVMIIVGQGLLFGGGTLVIILIFVNLKLAFAKKAEEEKAIPVDNPPTNNNPSFNYCQYCGSRLASNELKCLNCGAST